MDQIMRYIYITIESQNRTFPVAVPVFIIYLFVYLNFAYSDMVPRQSRARYPTQFPNMVP